MLIKGVDILSMSLLKSDLYVCLANGRIQVSHSTIISMMVQPRLQRYSASFDCTASWRCHNGIVLSSILDDQRNGTPKLITGGNDDNIKVAHIRGCPTKRPNVFVDLECYSTQDSGFSGFWPAITRCGRAITRWYVLKFHCHLQMFTLLL